ncbi:MAG: hypothetical protein R2911_22645 [Caldilineaceae bacterium]
MKLLNHSTTTRRSFLALLLGAPTALAAWKANEYAADPSGQKECLQLDPASAQPVIEPATVESESATFDLPWAQKGGAINDASCVNETAVYGIVQVRSEDDMRGAALGRARKSASGHGGRAPQHGRAGVLSRGAGAGYAAVQPD